MDWDSWCCKVWCGSIITWKNWHLQLTPFVGTALQVLALWCLSSSENSGMKWVYYRDSTKSNRWYFCSFRHAQQREKERKHTGAHVVQSNLSSAWASCDLFGLQALIRSLIKLLALLGTSMGGRRPPRPRHGSSWHPRALSRPCLGFIKPHAELKSSLQKNSPSSHISAPRLHQASPRLRCEPSLTSPWFHGTYSALVWFLLALSGPGWLPPESDISVRSILTCELPWSLHGFVKTHLGSNLVFLGFCFGSLSPPQHRSGLMVTFLSELGISMGSRGPPQPLSGPSRPCHCFSQLPWPFLGLMLACLGSFEPT